MKTQINSPAASKINWTAAIIAVIGLLVASGIIPDDYEKHLVTLATVLAPALIVIFRTWFTEAK